MSAPDLLRWDDQHDRCAGCGTRSQTKPHVAEGLCTACYTERFGGFGLGDVRPAWAEPGATLPPAPVAAAKPWHRLWPSCLVCGETKRKPKAFGCCDTCDIRSRDWRKRGIGLTLLWLPFRDGECYDLDRAERWVTVRDHDEALRYLARRAAAAGPFVGGKVVIRQTREADRLPERVIRPVAA